MRRFARFGHDRLCAGASGLPARSFEATDFARSAPQEQVKSVHAFGAFGFDGPCSARAQWIVPALSVAAQECELEGGGLLDSLVGYKGTDTHRDWGGALALWI